jgi:ATP-dependent DNA ligase
MPSSWRVTAQRMLCRAGKYDPSSGHLRPFGAMRAKPWPLALLRHRSRRAPCPWCALSGVQACHARRVGGGKALYKQACQLRLEGIISKRRDSVYTGTRSDDWLKVKCLNAEEFIIIGYTEPQRSRVGFGALLVGYYTPEGEIRYAGKVGTGYSREFLIDFQKRLEKIEHATPTAVLPKGTYMRAKVHWVKPRMLAQVEFTEWTRDRILRHPAFMGLREDKDPREVVIATESPTS